MDVSEWLAEMNWIPPPPPVVVVGVGTDEVAATTAGVAVALPPALVDGVGIEAVTATTAGETVEPALTVGAGTDVVADTTAGVAVADVPPAGIVTVNPIRELAWIVPDATKFAADVADDVASAL